MRHAMVLVGAAATVALVLGGAAPELWSNGGNGNFCSQTADLLFAACVAGVKDDTFVGKAICVNISNSADRQACLQELDDARDAANQLCEDQHEGRLDACELLGEGRYDPDVHPALFDNPKNPMHPNPYFPLKPGYKWKYKGGGQIDNVKVLNDTKLIAGVKCIVVRDVVTRDGELAESTDDWYAQAKNGTSWYFGEEVQDFETFDGDNPATPELVSIDGSFKAGRAGDKPGIIFLPSPEEGDVYLEEASLGNAEDVTEILSTSYAFGHDPQLDQAVAPQLAQRFCNHNDCVVTKNYSLLEPGLFARKYYARGIGVFLEVEVNPDSVEAIQLVSCSFDSRCNNLPQP